MPSYYDKLTADDIAKTIREDSLLPEDNYQDIKKNCIRLMKEL